jgi:hypothetical protein
MKIDEFAPRLSFWAIGMNIYGDCENESWKNDLG